MTDGVAQAQDLLNRIRDYAAKRGVHKVRWGFVLRSAYDDTGELRYQITTLGGETMYLTHALLEDLELVILQGETFAFLNAIDAGEPNQPVQELRIQMWLGEPGSRGPTHLSLGCDYPLGRSQPLICLCDYKPQGWPA